MSDGTAPEDEPAQAAAAPGTPTAPTRVASLQLITGQVVEFYDFGSAALIVETGAAYQKPVYNPKAPTPADQLVNVWTQLAPETPVPVALTLLQKRLTASPGDLASSPTLTAPPIARTQTGGGQFAQPGRFHPDAPSGCSNGCCDASWLSTFGQCQPGGYDYGWFLYNYGWTTATSTNDDGYNGLVCSAQGTSTFSVNMSSGAGGTWSITEAHYLTWNWSAGTTFLIGFNPKNMSSSVNSSSNMHLHTYCGGVIYD